MSNNRISQYVLTNNRFLNFRPVMQKKLSRPPANFSAVPTAYVGHLSKTDLSALQQFYRSAYEQAIARVRATRARNN